MEHSSRDLQHEEISLTSRRTASRGTTSEKIGNRSVQTPRICPESSRSMDAARETLGRPGMSIMLPEMTTTKPAPAEREALVTLRFQPVGAPSFLGSSDREY